MLERKIALKGGAGTSLALLLAACGSSSSDNSVALTITRENGGDYSSTGSVVGASVRNASSAVIDLAGVQDDTYNIELNAQGSDALEFHFDDVDETVILSSGSKISGFDMIKVVGGTLDAQNLDLSEISTIEVSSSVILSGSQLAEADGLYIQSISGDGTLKINVASDSEADAVLTSIEDGRIQLVNVEVSVVANDAASATKADALEDSASLYVVGSTKSTDDDGDGTNLVESVSSGAYVLNNEFGDLSLTASGTTFTVSGDGNKTGSGSLTGLADIKVDGVTLTFAADQLDAPLISGTGSVTVNKVEDNADIELSGVTATGDLTANVTDDVTFTGSIGNFEMVVASGATLTADEAVVSAAQITGAGAVSVTGMDSDTDLSAITNSGSQTATFDASKTFLGNFGTFDIVVNSGKTLTVDGDRIQDLTVSGAGNVTVTDGLGGEDITVLTTGTNSITLGSGNDDVNAGAGDDTVSTGAGDDRIVTLGGDDTINGGAGADSMNGGTGDDVYLFTADAASGDTLVDASGTDTLSTAGAGANVDLSAVNGGATALSEVDVLLIDSDFEAEYTSDQLTGLTLNIGEDAADAAITSLRVDLGAADTFNGQNFTFTAGGAWDDGSDVVDINGSTGADTIIGTSQADTITLGTADTAADKYVVAALTDGADLGDDESVEADKVSEFETGTDKIGIDDALEAALGNVGTAGVLNTGTFAQNALDKDTSDLEVFVFTGDLDDQDDLSDLITAVGTVTTSDGDEFFILANNTAQNSAGLYYVKSDGANAAALLTEAEIALVATIGADGDIGTGDFVLIT